MINNTAMKEKEAIPPREHKGAKDKNPAPDPKVGKLDCIEQKKKDKKQEDDIFNMADRLRNGIVIIIAILFTLICYSQCESTKKSIKKTDIERHQRFTPQPQHSPEDEVLLSYA